MPFQKLTYCSLLIALMAFQQSFAIDSLDIKEWQESVIFEQEECQKDLGETDNATLNPDIYPFVNPAKYQQINLREQVAKSAEKVIEIDHYSNYSIASLLTATIVLATKNSSFLHLDEKQNLLQLIQIFRE